VNCKINRRILVVDDQSAIHEDFRKILCAAESPGNLAQLEGALFGTGTPRQHHIRFEIDSAYQGQEGLACVEWAHREGHPYAMVFLDMRMPPGWDGAETATRLWEVCPELQIVLCTAYTEYSGEELTQKLGAGDRWCVLKKPFDNIEVHRLAAALTEKAKAHNPPPHSGAGEENLNLIPGKRQAG
jgi:CheY-like chemotaxis protein